ncbi:MAG: hypothetical protein UR94_C0034G0005 [Parcubacteria group bacterium GW2011_GWA2_36_10]|nr:MAG: hypothetical protein UR94_C0034G0005 [Parcubacteria group bacterium GW2011_GWA2_36_10]
MFKKIFLFNALALIALLPNISLARDVSKINDWYLKDFHSDIIVNTDSSLLITEKIIADCGNLAGKHGIFRVLPTQINTSEGKILTPIELVSITDYAGQPLKYSTTKQNNTITWKIGDPDITVKGENTYQIVYKVKNAIRFQENFEELWWNLNGNFWELETDNYTADIHFPEAISQDNTQIDYYTGLYGSKDKNLAIWEWQDKVLHFQSADILRKGEGISISVSMPKNIFTPYQITFSDKYPSWPWLAWPILTFIFCFTFWKKHGKDPHWHKTVIAEYEVPDNLTPMQMSMLSGLGILNNKAISGSIIKLACDGIIKIEEIAAKTLGFSKKDYKLTVVNEKKSVNLIAGEKFLLESIFEDQKEIILSDLKKTFYKKLPDIKKTIRGFLEENSYVEKNKYFSKVFLYSFGIYFIFLVFFLFFSGAVVFSLLIVFFFSLLMNKRTMKGAEVEWRIRGFKLFISTAEKYRAQFYEKENMFEKILPYAIAFGLTGKWVKAMKDIYGAEKFAAMTPVWFIGSGANFDIDNFFSALTSMTSAISQSASSSTGAGGGGFSGGGGGGGGGGGW